MQPIPLYRFVQARSDVTTHSTMPMLEAMQET